jgi:uncharacterized protein YndB with AHSA1/START domain
MPQQIVTTIEIQRPIDVVYTFVTTPANWPKWHPSSREVRGATDHSLEVGEQVSEDFDVAGRRGTALWTVTDREAPYRWVIEGGAPDGSRATIAYSFTSG